MGMTVTDRPVPTSEECLRHLAAAYNRREMRHVQFFPFELEGGRRLQYPTAKHGIIFPVAGRAACQVDHLALQLRAGVFVHICPGRQLSLHNKRDEPFLYVVAYYDGSVPLVFEGQLRHPDELIDLLRRIVAEGDGTELADAFHQELLIEQLFERFFEDVQPSAVSTDRDVLELAIAYVHEHMAERLTLAVLADQVGTTPTHLSYLFDKHVGVRPIDYVIDCRIKRAIELLRQPDSISIAEVAAQVGYADASYFSRIFKKRTGYSPSAIRAAKLRGPRQAPAGALCTATRSHHAGTQPAHRVCRCCARHNP